MAEDEGAKGVEKGQRPRGGHGMKYLADSIRSGDEFRVIVVDEGFALAVE